MKVLPIKSSETYPWLLNKHYAKRIPQIMYSFGLYENNDLIGVVTYGLPASPNLCEGICGKEFSKIVLELNRLCLMNNDKNQASFLVANSIKLLPQPSIIVSYADISKGHIGYVYQATNFLYTGLSADRTIWAVKGLEHLHDRTLGGNGVTVKSMIEKYGDDFYYKKRDRKHRYIYFHGNKKDKKTLTNLLKYQLEPYPKGDSKKYNSGSKVETQGILFV
jgi:hypothetical protein